MQRVEAPVGGLGVVQPRPGKDRQHVLPALCGKVVDVAQVEAERERCDALEYHPRRPVLHEPALGKRLMIRVEDDNGVGRQQPEVVADMIVIVVDGAAGARARVFRPTH